MCVYPPFYCLSSRRQSISRLCALIKNKLNILYQVLSVRSICFNVSKSSTSSLNVNVLNTLIALSPATWRKVLKFIFPISLREILLVLFLLAIQFKSRDPTSPVQHRAPGFSSPSFIILITSDTMSCSDDDRKPHVELNWLYWCVCVCVCLLQMVTQ